MEAFRTSRRGLANWSHMSSAGFRALLCRQPSATANATIAVKRSSRPRSRSHSPVSADLRRGFIELRSRFGGSCNRGRRLLNSQIMEIVLPFSIEAVHYNFVGARPYLPANLNFWMRLSACERGAALGFSEKYPCSLPPMKTASNIIEHHAYERVFQTAPCS